MMSRLIVLVLVPLTVLAFQTVRTAVERSHAMHDAIRVRASTAQMKAVMRLGFAVSEERVPLFARMYAARIGFGVDAAYPVLGYPSTWVADTRRTVDAAFAAVPAPTGRLAQVLTAARADMARARVLADTGAQDQAAVDLMAGAQQALEAQTRDLAEALVDRIGAGPVRAGTLRDVLALQLVYDAAVLQTELLKRTFDLSMGRRLDAAGVSEARRRYADYESYAVQIDRLAAPPVRKALAALTGSAVGAALVDQITGTVGATGSVRLAPNRLGTIALFRTALQLRDEHYRLLAEATAQVDRGLDAFLESTRRAFRDAIAQGVLANLLALAFALLLARSITRPLRLIADRARRIHAGDLRVERVGRAGPREIADVARAFDDVAANLRLVEDQATALARGDTGDPVLLRRVPGRLGHSLQESVAQLSSTLQARDAAEARLRHEATHDRLTNALNRSAAVVALEQAVARAQRAGAGLAVLVADLDGLTAVNGRHGQQAGDALLVETARRLQESVRDGDVVARTGADEFLVVAEVASEEAAVDVGRRVASGLAALHLAALPDEDVTVSLGMALSMDGLVGPAQVLREAEEAARRAHRDGGGRLEFFDDALRAKLSEQERFRLALIRALRDGDLHLVYQPVVSGDGRTVGAEALSRWDDAELGPVSPGVFIPVAESSDLILDLDRWVLRTAADQLAQWQRDPVHAGRYLSVNVSGKHLLDASFVPDVAGVLAGHRFDPALLVLEITETVLLDDLVAAAEQLAAVRALGVRIAVDDFGTGYTSIAHLQRLPVDILKIDRSFVTDIVSDRGLSLVRLMVDMASTLGMGVVAEGVEEPIELQLLRSLGDPLIQGYFTGRPMDANAIQARFAGKQPAR